MPEIPYRTRVGAWLWFDFGAVVNRTFTRLAQNRELVQLYNKWFQQRLPTGETLDLPMSPQLEEVFRVEGVPD